MESVEIRNPCGWISVQQFFVAATVGQFALLHDQNGIGVDQCGQTVRDHDDRGVHAASRPAWHRALRRHHLRRQNNTQDVHDIGFVERGRIADLRCQMARGAITIARKQGRSVRVSPATHCRKPARRGEMVQSVPCCRWGRCSASATSPRAVRTMWLESDISVTSNS